MSDRLKLELADELGFGDKVRTEGWGEVTTRQAGSLVRAAIERAERKLAQEERR
ncbi:MAG: small, acid-soluble spore protein, alpha/beta type [Betaproteobacteria bacterium]